MFPVEGAVIACAGLGSRLGMGLPKCMIEIGGRTILTRLIDSLSPHVPRIHVVMGYREELIINHCSRYHRDVVMVRNPDFRETNTAHSLRMGSVGFSRKVLYLDGDLIINEYSLNSFISQASSCDLLVGVTSAKSSQAVFVNTSGCPKTSVFRTTGFSREMVSPYEWGNIFSGSPKLLHEGSRYVYECIEPHLPAAAALVDLHEVDTPEDLALANLAISSSC